MEMFARHQKRHEINDLENRLNEHADYNKYLMENDPEGQLVDYSATMDVKGAQDVFKQRTKRLENDPDFEFGPQLTLLDSEQGVHIIPDQQKDCETTVL